MPQKRGSVIIGITEIGAVRTGADVSWGRTTEDGCEIAIDGSDLDVMSGQSTMIMKSVRTADTSEVTVNLLYSDLLNMAEALGQIAGPTGDLQAGTPTAEVLQVWFNGAVGKREDKIYLITPGPKSTRRWEWARMQVKPGVRVRATKGKEQVLTFTLKMLEPLNADPPLKITDNP